MVKVIVNLIPSHIAKLDEIAFEGYASSGYRHDFEFVLRLAIKEFIKKYEKKEKN